MAAEVLRTTYAPRNSPTSMLFLLAAATMTSTSILRCEPGICRHTVLQSYSGGWHMRLATCSRIIKATWTIMTMNMNDVLRICRPLLHYSHFYFLCLFSRLLSFHSLVDILIKESPPATGSGVMPSQDLACVSTKHKHRR